MSKNLILNGTEEYNKNQFNKFFSQNFQYHQVIRQQINQLKQANLFQNEIFSYAEEFYYKMITDKGLSPLRMIEEKLRHYVDWVYAHSVHVCVLSLILAKQLGYREQDLKILGLGAFLHDVGKLFIPLAILQKNGPLNDYEMSYMRRHSELGVQYLSSFCMPKECMKIVLQHHERLDGSGYPYGLQKNQINQNAQIVMIADAFNAITFYRPYKKEKDARAAIDLLKNEKGKYCSDYLDTLEKLLLLY